jgi:hypothetical protein
MKSTISYRYAFHNQIHINKILTKNKIDEQL